MNNNYFIDYEHSIEQKQAHREVSFPTDRQGQPLFQRSPHSLLHTSAKKVKTSLLSKLIKNRSILPTFNADRKYYTYAFQLPSSPIENEQQMLEEHHKRASEAEAEHSELVLYVLGSGCPNPEADTNTAESAEATTRTTSNISNPISTKIISKHRDTSSL